MKFDDLDKHLRIFETSDDYCILPDIHIVVRLDGRGFTRLTKEVWQLEPPFDVRFKEAMQNTVIHLLNCGFDIIYGYTQSDEISLLFKLNENSFKRKTRKIISVLAGEASACFSLALGKMASFDARISQLPTQELVINYFRWRQEDAHRNALNAHCYWLLRQQGFTPDKASQQLKGKSQGFKNELLFQQGINFNELPAWQKRGTGVYWHTYQKSGVNPITGKTTLTDRKQIKVDEQLALGDDYSHFIQQLLAYIY